MIWIGAISNPATNCDDTTGANPVQSSRETDILLSKTVFWDERNKSTWHYDYPDMMLSQYNKLVKIAKTHREKFIPGEQVFEKFLERYRKYPQVTDAARPSMTIRNGTRVITNAGKAAPRILARLTATSGSVLPCLQLNITKPFTSWGRGFNNTVVYRPGYEDRIPKYAFKLILWKQGLSASNTRTPQQDLSFWISTKATMGIKVNGIHIKSHQRNQPLTASKKWGQLRHGDEITIWRKENLYMKFRFECYFGASTARRQHDISLLPKSKARDKLDGYCLQAELKARARKMKKTYHRGK